MLISDSPTIVKLISGRKEASLLNPFRPFMSITLLSEKKAAVKTPAFT